MYYQLVYRLHTVNRAHVPACVYDSIRCTVPHARVSHMQATTLALKRRVDVYSGVGLLSKFTVLQLCKMIEKEIMIMFLLKHRNIFNKSLHRPTSPNMWVMSAGNGRFTMYPTYCTRNYYIVYSEVLGKN